MANIGWFPNIATAEAYFATERLETASWDALADGTTSGEKDEKTAVLTQAYNRIYYSKDFDVPDYSSATAAQLVILQKAQAEMAYYLAGHLEDEDARKGLQAQGVKEAGTVKEVYSEANLGAVPIPPVVVSMLGAYATGETGFYSVDIDRDEPYHVSDDVTDCE